MFRTLCIRALTGARPVSGLKKFHVASILKKCPKMDKGDYIPEGYTKFKLKQAKFQLEDGLPVFLKGGPRDMLLYKATIVLTVLTTIYSLAFIISVIAESMPARDDQFAVDPNAPPRDC